MKQWQIQSFGIESLELVEKESTAPGRGQVLVQVHAASLNYRDLMMVKGFYNPKLKVPRIPCSDGAGEVLAVGEGVTRWKAGDRVCGTFFQSWLDGRPTAVKTKGALGGDLDGMLATEVVLDQAGLVAVPAHLSYEEAATLPCAALTAWNALFTAADTRPGDTVLVQGTGGVSIFALQFAKLAGARVLGTSSSDAKLLRARALGLDAGLNYRDTPEWEKWAIEVTGGEGVDLVVEVGGADTLARSLKAVKPGGTVAQIGVLSGPNDGVDIRPVLVKQIRLHGIFVGSRTEFEAMNRAVAVAKLKPVVDVEFGFAEAREALRRMESAAHFGKIVIAME